MIFLLVGTNVAPSLDRSIHRRPFPEHGRPIGVRAYDDEHGSADGRLPARASREDVIQLVVLGMKDAMEVL